VPDSIIALSTCRDGGVSQAPYDSLNVALHVGDDPKTVTKNRQRLLQQCPDLLNIQWLEQVHGNKVFNLDGVVGGPIPQADACFTREAGIACAVMTADCLPILLCSENGEELAAVHAGWRGLADGVIESTIKQFSAPVQTILAWMGPAISQQQFEVGVEVRQQFLDNVGLEQQALTESAFIPNPARKNHYLADLYRLAEIRLQAIGVTKIYGGDHCSFTQREDFFSYRRDGKT
jgi:YfiH family protein